MIRTQSKHLLLIADADTENVYVLESMLAADFDIKVAADGQETIRLAAAADAPDLILLNSIMPPADLAEICTKLKGGKTTRDIPIIFLSEPTLDDTEARGFELGAADYITKPFKKSVVNARVRTHLALKRYRDNFEKRVKKQMSELHNEILEHRDIENTFHALIEHAMDGIVIVHDYKVRFANPAFCNLIGFSEKELKGAHLKKFISEKEFIKNTTRYSSRIAGLNLPRIYKSQVIHSDGSTIDVELNVSVVPYGRTLAALVFVRDVREEEAWKYCI
jgi:PAS domain S-box-containing protein